MRFKSLGLLLLIVVSFFRFTTAAITTSSTISSANVWNSRSISPANEPSSSYGSPPSLYPSAIMPSATIMDLGSPSASITNVPLLPSPQIPGPPSPPSNSQRCPEQVDPLLGIRWPRTQRNMGRIQPCPLTFTGNVTRFCNRRGNWEKPYIAGCEATTIDTLEDISDIFFSDDSMDEDETAYFVRQLRRLTNPPSRRRRGAFLSRKNLRTIKKVARNSLNSFRMTSNVTTDDVTDVFGLFSNALDSRNRESWEDLQETESGSEELLSNAEEYSNFATTLLQQAGETLIYSEENIALRINRVSVVNADLCELSFPAIEDLVNTSNVSTDTSNITIPLEYIRTMAGPSGEDVSAAFMLFPTLNDFLPYSAVNDMMNKNVSIGSVILSAQVQSSVNYTQADSKMMSTPLDTHPIELIFSINVSTDDYFKPSCVYWNFTDDFNSTSSGGWLSDGIVTELIDNSTVRCLSSHLTSFAVLVDVSGTHFKEDTYKNETATEVKQALSYISYIGTGLSVICLMATIVFLLSLGKELFTKVHYFIHFNLSVSLMLGLIVFIGGINYASKYEISCKVVAILLHYFFLSAFCWMLCEAIQLCFLLVVDVFKSVHANRWYLFLVIGWAVPLVVVIPTVGFGFDEYIKDSPICWLSYSTHIIWAFIGPICIIILINIIILVVVSIQLFRIQRKLTKAVYSGNGSQRISTKTAITLFKGIIFQLPLFGITWVVGILAFNRSTVVFAWLFTILNSLQGVFIFIFHVVVNPVAIAKIKRIFCKKSRATPTTESITLTKGRSVSRLKSMESLDSVA